MTWESTGADFDRADEDTLDQDPAQKGDRHGQDEGDPERYPRLNEHPGDIGGEHRHLALGEIHRFGRLMDHDERQGQARVDGTRGETRENLLEELLHGFPVAP